MKTITFYSYKGGVGRSLTLSNIATRLADLGKRVCIIDFDLEAPGLHLKFTKYLDDNSINKGIVEYIQEFQDKSFIPDNINDYIVDVNYNATLNGSIKLIPAGSVFGSEYWQNLSSINWKELFYSKENNGISLLLHLKEIIKRDLNPNFILIDSRTGITDISGIAMTLLSDKIVMLAANNAENISGTGTVIKSLLSDENNLTGKLPEIYFVLSRIPYYSSPEKKHIETRLVNNALESINKDEKLIEKVFVIHSDRELEEEEKFKINNISNETLTDENTVPIGEDYLILFEELTKGDLTGDEVERFNNLRESALLIDDARATKDNAIKIGLLKKAIELNTNSHEAYYLLAATYNQLYSYEKSLEYIEEAIKIDNYNSFYKWIKALNFKGLNKIDESIQILNKIIEDDEGFYFAYGTLGHINYLDGKFEEALNYNLKYIVYNKDDSNAYNSIGNSYRVLKDYKNAFKFIYKCLELDPKNRYGTGTLAEIYADLNNEDEFYKNLQLSFVFGINSKEFQDIINTEKNVYEKYFKEERFLNLLKMYRIKISLPNTKKKGN